MAKFYVQSGTLKAIVDSDDAQRAALWAVHQAMQQIAPVNEPASQTSNSTPPFSDFYESAPQKLISLGDTIILSEVGFDHDDAFTIDTFEAFREWHALWHALERVTERVNLDCHATSRQTSG